MAFGKITGSVIQDNTITESNLAFGVSGQSAASVWATDTLKVNILESDDSTAIQLNDALNVSGALTVNNDLYLPDGKKLYLGDSNDVQIYQDSGSSAAFVHKQTAGDFYIKANTNIFFQTSSTKAAIYAFDSGAIELYHNGSKKFETLSTGAEVTGDLKVDSISANDSSVVSFNSPIHVDTISSSDSTAIQINDSLDVNGAINVSGDAEIYGTLYVNAIQGEDSTQVLINQNTLINGVLYVNQIGSKDSTQIYVEQGLIVQSGSTFNSDIDMEGHLYVNNVSANDSTEILFGTGIGVNGRITATALEVGPVRIQDNTIQSLTSSAIQIDDGVNISGTLSVGTIDVNTLTSSDSSGININETKLYVNGGTVITTTSFDEPALTTNSADVDQVLINDGGIAKRIALGSINISSFNNDANYASAAGSGFTNSTVTSFPLTGDSSATDYGEGESQGVGTASATTDAFGVPLGTTFDCMEPNGSTQSTDLGTEEAYVGA